jgi:hypothetical protein
MGEPTELIGWDGVFCPNRLGGCYIIAFFLNHKGTEYTEERKEIVKK